MNSGIYAKRAVAGAVLAFCLSVVILNLYTAVHYYSVMPRGPQPETGRVYPTMAAYGARVYVKEREHDWLDFLHYDLTSAGAVSMLLLYALRTRKWF